MTAVLALPVVVFGEFEPPSAAVVPSPPMVLAGEYLSSVDELPNAVAEDALENREEDRLTDEAEALATSTTTTSTTTTTTTAPAPASSQNRSASAPPAQSGGSGSGSSPPATQAPAPTTTKPPPPPSGFYSSGMESDFYGRINSLRASNGLGGLSSSGSLASYARSWAKWMGDHGKLAHSNIGSLAPPWASVGENVGRGGSVGGVFSALAGSSGHLSNMLGNFTHVGVGVWVDSSGTLWTVHVFAR